ncbi:hypothetical protein CNR30_01360 [Levilactobacillus brevis]|uniref:hypothetical protein n=1 Tax=Levilactobacillus brevis TaxID=1580 RepID=UPI00069407F3|nr:hypothetical protein [Levilactobacillus brevis]RDF15351.1 hypothetical protein CNR30_01360 [Levilactobacillus brevis]
MATPNVGILTTTGKALIDKVNSGQAKISFSKVVFSSMDNSQLSDTQIQALTAIAPQEVVVSSPQTTLDTNSGETRIRATGTNEKLADGVYVKTYGVFAKDDTGNEILYGVTVSPNPNYFPAYDGVTPQAVTYSYKTVIQETSNITMTNSNDVYVSQEDLTEAIAKIPQPDLSGYDKTDDVDKKLQNKQDKLGYTAANDSAVVHSTDMRKPASDVAGIEEVNAKQDKLTITPADDSKVVHTSDTSNWQKSKVTDDAGMPLLMLGDTDDLSAKLNGLPNGYFTIYCTGKTLNNPSASPKRGIIHITASTRAGSGILFSEDKNAYIITMLLGTVTYTKMADDSKVAHLSGANNFDTVPTVNNNPLLLASSLPSDLARTSQRTNFTAGLQSGGVDVATAADLKSVKDSAWRPLKLVSSTSGTILFKDNGDGTASLTGSAIFNVAQDKDNFVAEVDAPDGYVFTSVDWKINIDSSTQIIGINSQYAVSETGSSNNQALMVRIQDGNLLIGGSNNWNQNNLITFNAFNTNLKTVSLAGSPATIGITKLN